MSRSEQVFVSPRARVDPSARFSRSAVVHDDVTIGAGARIGDFVVIHPGTRIGGGVTIQDHAVIGKAPRTSSVATLGARPVGTETVVGDGAAIGAGAVIYAGCRVGKGAFIGDKAALREGCEVGEDSVLGLGVSLESRVTVGRRCLVFTASYLSEDTVLEDDVFVGARVCTASGTVMSFRRSLPCESRGPVIRAGARVGTGSTLHPGITIGREAVVALGAVVFTDVPEATLVLGNPARVVKKVPAEEFLRRREEDI